VVLLYLIIGDDCSTIEAPRPPLEVFNVVFWCDHRALELIEELQPLAILFFFS
jgi:hypothetical protein